MLRSVPAMQSDFATKLRVTAAALGCASRKDLCARFRAVNPGTHFDLERSHKWLQGRALPRSAQVYDDWAKVLGTKRSGAWLASCTGDAFLEEICALYDADPATLAERAEVSAEDAAGAASHSHSEAGYLCGTYVCYSLAWSPYYRGQIIRGALTVGTGRKGVPLQACYAEALLTRQVRFDGEVLIAGRTVHIDLRGSRSIAPLFMSLHLPGPPASVLSGVMSGAITVAPEAEPAASRMVAVRVPVEATASNRYFAPISGTIAADLLASGLRLSAPENAEVLIRDFLLGPGLNQVPQSDQTQLTSLFDRCYLDSC